MEDQIIQSRIAHLESVNDQLSTELQELDRLLRLTGFPEGIRSVTHVAKDMLEDGTVEDYPEAA